MVLLFNHPLKLQQHANNQLQSLKSAVFQSLQNISSIMENCYRIQNQTQLNFIFLNINNVKHKSAVSQNEYARRSETKTNTKPPLSIKGSQERNQNKHKTSIEHKIQVKREQQKPNTLKL